MKVLLLEKIKRLGNVGDLVVVSSGFARNYLFLRKKALRLTNENEEKFKREKAKIEQVNEEKKSFFFPLGGINVNASWIKSATNN